MRNSFHQSNDVRASTSTRSLRAEELKTYLSDRSRACDAQIDAIHRSKSMHNHKRLSVTAPASKRSESPKKSTSFRLPEDSDESFSDPSRFSESRRWKRSMNRSASSSARNPPPTASSSPPLDRSAPISHKCRDSSELQSTGKRGILKKNMPKESVRERGESAEQWFQRIMRAKQLSPLDLCDLFSYGDARRHQTVALSHVCEVLFDLDPETVHGYDPVTPQMEEFLYQFSFENNDENEEAGEIVVNVKDALRALNIWQSGITSPPSEVGSSRLTKGACESPSKTVILETKNKKLMGVISSLQDANLRLSQQLDQATSSSKSRPVSTSMSLSSSMLGSTWLAHSSADDSTKSSATKCSEVVNTHEHELIRIANQLQYDGVKKLEELLVKTDKTSSGFVSLKQLRWLLGEHFQVDSVTETQLMEICLGMNFNAQAQLDFHEFVHVLLDVLIYAASPKVAASARQQLCSKMEQYLHSGFPHCDRRKNRAMLFALCEKYDLEGNQQISVSEMMRVLFNELEKHHATHSPFPLAQEDALRVLQPFVKELHSSNSNTTHGFVSYPEFVDSLFASSGDMVDSGDADAATSKANAASKKALDWGFWVKLRKTLCSGNLALEPKIHAQLCKIFQKLDPTRTFLVSQRHLHRILDNHVSPSDLDVLSTALAEQGSSNLTTDAPSDDSQAMVRYDIFMKLVFGAPALRDRKLLHQLTHKLNGQDENPPALRKRIVELMKKRGGGWQATLPFLHDLLCVDDSGAKPVSSLQMTELLYLFALLDSDHEGCIDLKTLWNFFKNECWTDRTASRHKEEERVGGGSGEIANEEHQRRRLRETQQLLLRCLSAYNLERALSGYKEAQNGWISQDQLLHEVYEMLHALGLDRDDAQDESLLLDPANLQQFLASMAVRVNDADPELFRMGRLHLQIPIDAFFDALFNWGAMLNAMRLPHNLVAVKQTLELFDWSKNGSIAVEDWNKAWRQICCPQHSSRNGMAEWELGVLARQFPSPSSLSDRSSDKKDGIAARIDYARLLVHLMDSQHSHARKRLKTLVETHFRAKCARIAAASPSASGLASQIDKLFHQVDGDGKGFFTLRDLQQYLSQSLVRPATRTATTTRGFSQERGGEEDGEADDEQLLIQNVNAMAHAISFLAGNTDAGRGSHEQSRAMTVTRDRFRKLMRRLMSSPSPTASSSSPNKAPGFREDDFSETRAGSRRKIDPSGSSPRGARQSQVLTSLRALELAILDICSDVSSSANGRILPTRAFRYFSDGVLETEEMARRRAVLLRSRPRSRSPSRSPTRSPMSMTARSQHRQVESMLLDPITPVKLKQLLQTRHNLRVSSHLVAHFFQHIGSSSKYFLELLPFAKWVAPLTIDMQSNVRTIVKKMLVRGKGGGGKVDLDRFLAQLHRRLLESPPHSSAASGDEDHLGHDLRFVRPSLLQAALNQLEIPLSRQEMELLLHHFGMEEDDEIDYALFLQRIYELSATSSA